MPRSSRKRKLTSRKSRKVSKRTSRKVSRRVPRRKRTLGKRTLRKRTLRKRRKRRSRKRLRLNKRGGGCAECGANYALVRGIDIPTSESVEGMEIPDQLAKISEANCPSNDFHPKVPHS